MTPKEKIEGNKLIAEFMGEIPLFHKTAQQPTGAYYLIDKGHARLSPLEYHVNWSWLMPVYHRAVYDVLGQKSELKNNNDVRLFQEGCVWLSNLRTAMVNIYPNPFDHIKGVWQVSLSFVKWYNQNHNTLNTEK